MSEATPTSADPGPIRSKKKVFGPCGDCAFFDRRGMKANRISGRCHGAPPAANGWPVIEATAPGCAVFLPKGE